MNREEGRVGYQRLKVSSSQGVVTVQDTMRRYRRIRSVDEFNLLHPNEIPDTEFED